MKFGYLVISTMLLGNSYAAAPTHDKHTTVCPKTLERKDVIVLGRGFAHSPKDHRLVVGGSMSGLPEKTDVEHTEFKVIEGHRFTGVSIPNLDHIDDYAGLTDSGEMGKTLNSMSDSNFKKNLKFLQEVRLGKGSNQPGLSGEILCKYEIPVGKKTYTFGIKTHEKNSVDRKVTRSQ